MTEKHVAQFLIEDASENRLGKRAAVFVNRMMLRFFSAPPVLVNLTGINLLPHGDDSNALTVELEFHRLPDEVLPDVIKLISAPSEITQLKYVSNGSARTGFTFELSEDVLSADEYELAT